MLRRKIGPGRDLGPEMLGDKENLKHLCRYIKNTGRFEESHGVIEPTAKKNNANPETAERNDEAQQGEEWDDRTRWG